jgi:hypothetical protein
LLRNIELKKIIINVKNFATGNNNTAGRDTNTHTNASNRGGETPASELAPAITGTLISVGIYCSNSKDVSNCRGLAATAKNQ